MILAHKIALAPNNVQRTHLAQAAGTARFAYNWALAQWKEQYEAYKEDDSLPKPSQFSLRRQLNSIKREQFPWMLNVTKNAPQMAIIQLGTAFKNFFEGRAGYPVFRKKGIQDRFTITNDQFRVEGSRIRIPKLGWVRMREALRFTGKIQSATISRVADRWFVSISVDTEDLSHLPKAKNQGAVGVDLGVNALATLSTGETFVGPKPHKALLKRIKLLSRSLSRKQKGSSNRNKAKERLARLHARVANIRRDSLHKLTSQLTQHHPIIGIEDLNVSGMVKNRHLSRSINDMGFFEFRRQLEYKASMRGNEVVVIDRWFPSSKTCSACGHKRETLPLFIRQWKCDGCGQQHDRDINAAINLKNMAVSSTVIACGEEGSGLKHLHQVKPASVKQEAIFKSI